MLIELLALYFLLLPVLCAFAVGGYCADKIEEKCKPKNTKIKIDYK
jgi:hypothetical protein